MTQQNTARNSRAQRRRNMRMEDAVRLRGKGWSLRQIASRLCVSYETIRRDLDRWQRDQKVSHLPVTNVTKSVTNVTGKCDGKVVPIREAS